MIVYFAAYPNSKDFLLLQAFYKVFGIPWYEADIADQTDLKVSEEEARGGFRSAGEPWRLFYDKFHSSNESVVFARTRRLPDDKRSFVYVSRNPVSVLMEAAANRSEEGLDFPTALTREILGMGELPDWTAHYRAWSEHSKGVPGCFVRVEDFCADPLTVLTKIAARIMLPQPEFLDAHSCALPPDNFGEFEHADPDAARLLFSLHGQAMKQIGYLEPVPSRDVESLEDLPAAFLAKCLNLVREDVNSSKAAAAGKHTMARYIDSLENQYRRDTERLVTRIQKLSENK